MRINRDERKDYLRTRERPAPGTFVIAEAQGSTRNMVDSALRQDADGDLIIRDGSKLIGGISAPDLNLTTVDDTQVLYKSGNKIVGSDALTFDGSTLVVGDDPGGSAKLRTDGNIAINPDNPKSWSGTRDVIEGGNAGALIFDGSSAATLFGANAYNDGSWKRITANPAVLFNIDAVNRNFQVLTTATGAADSAISWSTEMEVGAGEVIIGTDPGGSDLLRVGGALRVQSYTSLGAVSVSTVNGTVNQLSNQRSLFIHDGSSTLTINGIAAGSPAQEITIQNNTTNTVTINNESASATAVDRIRCPGAAAITLGRYESATFKYGGASTFARWVCTGIA